MRQIGFRGKAVDGTYHKGMISVSSGFPNQPKEGLYISNFAGYPWAFHIIPETLSEFADFHDKYGKQLYENDIVKDDFANRIMVVEYHNSCFCFKSLTETNFKWANMKDWILWENGKPTDRGEFEIIGNVYDNPEYLPKDTHVSA